MNAIQRIERVEEDNPFARFVGMSLEELDRLEDNGGIKADVGTRARLLADAIPGVVTADRPHDSKVFLRPPRPERFPTMGIRP